ncbi:ABC transporter permease [Halopseudomonas salegens]|uniref:Nitrate/nitrite transport system permease protein n=1 Tax=Halopseudomonas salegens TaxID=1434072 RepID=A0A1H2ETN2_9GAMM|nr:ABC transporter permease [Halopseudomonas salegens]SDT98313.1 nitrate/nitrite transport system permease protein [Halopseudomonas salegens]
MSNRIIHYMELSGLNWMVPVVRLFKGENWREQARDLFDQVGLPMLAIGIFLLLWAAGASQVNTSLGQLPGPVQVWEQAGNLYEDHQRERSREAAFMQRQEDRNAQRLAENPDAEVRWRSYTGAPTFIDQVFTSLKTVFTGFILASLIAIPIGVACGLSQRLYGSISPLVQILKPVSPLAWLPIVTLVVSAVYVSDDPMFSRSFITSAITVTLCSLWPTLINTAVAVGSIDRDWINVGRVIRLPLHKRIFKIAIPAALPMIFTGLRISLGIGWMVLIAAEMLAQNPGLGKFIWDEFQNGSSNSLGRIMVAVLVIGFIGFLLDWLMVTLQKCLSHDKQAA